MTTCPNAVLHPWLKQESSEVLAALPDAPPTAKASRAVWERWQAGLAVKPTLPVELPFSRDPPGERSVPALPWRVAANRMVFVLYSVQNGAPTPKMNCVGELALTVWATSKRSMVRSTKPNHVTSSRSPPPTACATGPTWWPFR